MQEKLLFINDKRYRAEQLEETKPTVEQHIINRINK